MKKIIVLAINILSVMALTLAPAMAYSDADSVVYKEETEELSLLNIISGFEDGTFRPQENLTRAQAAKMIAAAGGFKLTDEEYSIISNRNYAFSDFDSSHWAYPYVYFIMPNSDQSETSFSVIEGFEDGTFRPDEYVTAAQFIKMAVCVFGENGYYPIAEENGGYPDGYVKTAEEYGILNEVSLSDINDNLTRGQAAKILSNTINIPFKASVIIYDINDNHEKVESSLAVTYDGTNNHYPLTTVKSLLAEGSLYPSEYIDVSPLEESEECFAYGEIDSLSETEITIKPNCLINTDGSVYTTSDKFNVAGDSQFNTENSAYYYFFKLKKENGQWVIDNYAVINK
ncbi:MAG: S-layer homology domain-containing protein [Oscillospiraceae bacterium]|nr:S-layer homology domain-containing protein [Oscillospiraceae bacterium]